MSNKPSVSCAAPYHSSTLGDIMDRFTINEIGQAIYVNDLNVRIDRIPNENQQQQQQYYHNDTQSDIASISDSPISSCTSSFYQPQTPTTITKIVETPIPDHLSCSKEFIFELQSLTEIYFDHVHKYVPMIHKPTFLKQLNHTTSAPSKLLLYAMCAVASRWSPDHITSVNSTTPAGYTYYTRALELLDDLMDSSRLSTVQALVLIVKYQEYYQRQGYYHRSYFYLGIAVRMCFDLGLSQLDNDVVDAEQKRRTFWIVFMYDLLSGIEQGRSSYFQVDQCKTGFPIVTGEEGPALEEFIINQNILIQLGKVLSEIYVMTRRITERQALQHDRRTKEQTIEEQTRLFSLHTHLENFLYEVPPAMIYPPTSDIESYPADKQVIGDPFIGFLHMTYHFSVILLHRTYLSCPPPPAVSTSISKSSVEEKEEEEQYEEEQEQQPQFIPYQHRKLCASSASNITIIAETMYEMYPSYTFHYPTRGVSHTLHCLAMAATIHKYEMTYSDNEVTRINARQQYTLSLQLMQQLSSQSPARDEMAPYFDQAPVNSILEEEEEKKKRLSTASAVSAMQQQQAFHFAPEQPVVAVTPQMTKGRRNTLSSTGSTLDEHAALYQSSASIASDMTHLYNQQPGYNSYQQQQMAMQQQWHLSQEELQFNQYKRQQQEQQQQQMPMSWSSNSNSSQQQLYYNQPPPTYPMEMMQQQQKMYNSHSLGGGTAGRIRRHTVSTPSDEQLQLQQQQAYYSSTAAASPAASSSAVDHHHQFMVQQQQQQQQHVYIKNEYDSTNGMMMNTTADATTDEDTIMMDSSQHVQQHQEQPRHHYDPSSGMSQLFLTDNQQHHQQQQQISWGGGGDGSTTMIADEHGQRSEGHVMK